MCGVQLSCASALVNLGIPVLRPSGGDLDKLALVGYSWHFTTPGALLPTEPFGYPLPFPSPVPLTTQEEAARTRGTPLTPELFNAWAKKFRAEVAAMRAKEEEERVRTLPAKEREEWRRRAARPSGRQLFETAKVSATSDEAFADEGATAVDVSKYSREERDRNRWEEGEEHGAGVDLVDSDDE